MKILGYLLAALIGAALATITLSSRSADERDRARKEFRAARDASLAREKEAAAKAEALDERVAELTAEAAEWRAKATAAALPSAEAPATIATEEPAPAKPEAKNSMAGFLDKMLSDPQMKKAMQTQQTMAMKQFYGDYVKAAGLTPAQADQLYELIGERQMRSMEGASALLKDGPEGAGATQMSEVTAKFNEDLRQMVGEDKAAEFQTFEKTLGDRIALNQLNQQLAANGNPLTADQSKGMLEIIADERTRTPATVMQPGSTQAMTMSDSDVQTFLEQQAELNGRVRTRATSLLTPPQLQALEAAQKQQLEMQKMGMTMARQMFKR